MHIFLKTICTVLQNQHYLCFADVDYCYFEPCLGGARYSNTPTGPRCNCPLEFGGDRCQCEYFKATWNSDIIIVLTIF